LNCRAAVGAGEDGVVGSQRAARRRNEDHLDALDPASFGVGYLDDEGIRQRTADRVCLRVAVDDGDGGGLAGIREHQVATAGVNGQQRKAQNNS
jgi:hypothetical protein